MCFWRFTILGVVIMFIAHIDTGKSRPTSSATAAELRDRAERQTAASDSQVRHVVRNCTQNPNASDQEILDCMLPTLQTSGKCPPPAPKCTPKTAQNLVAQYLQIPKVERGFALSELPAAANSNQPHYVGFPDRGFSVSQIAGAANSACYAKSYKYIHLGNDYFPSTLLVVSECSTKPGCTGDSCEGRTLHPGINEITVLNRRGEECEEDGTEFWQPQTLVRLFPLACGCGASS